MRPTELSNRWLEAVLAAGYPSWSAASLERARIAAGLTCVQARQAAPAGGIDLVDTWFERADRSMQNALADCPKEAKIRARATLAVRASIEELANKQALRGAVWLTLRPQNVHQSFKMNWRFSDRAWRAMGDKTEGFGYYSKRAILLGVKGSTLIYWLKDQSTGSAATWSFLDRRIEDVMRIGTIKAAIKRWSKRR